MADSEFMLKVELMDLADGLCVECGREGSRMTLGILV